MCARDDSGGASGRQHNGQLEALARDMAARFGVTRQGGRPAPLLDRLDGYERLLREAHRQYTLASAAQRGLPYAAEWLLDNFYVIQQAIRQVREDMPPAYYQQLPSLADSAPAGLPRGMPGMGEDIERPMQQAPQPGRQFMERIKTGCASTRRKT